MACHTIILGLGLGLGLVDDGLPRDDSILRGGTTATPHEGEGEAGPGNDSAGFHETVAGDGAAAAFFAFRRALSIARRHEPKDSNPSCCHFSIVRCLACEKARENDTITLMTLMTLTNQGFAETTQGDPKGGGDRRLRK